MQTIELAEKTRLAAGDKQEVYRDLATFEFNFSKHNQKALFTSLEIIENKIKDTFDNYTNKSKYHGIIGWLCED